MLSEARFFRLSNPCRHILSTRKAGTKPNFLVLGCLQGFETYSFSTGCRYFVSLRHKITGNLFKSCSCFLKTDAPVGTRYVKIPMRGFLLRGCLQGFETYSFSTPCGYFSSLCLKTISQGLRFPDCKCSQHLLSRPEYKKPLSGFLNSGRLQGIEP